MKKNNNNMLSFVVSAVIEQHTTGNTIGVAFVKDDACLSTRAIVRALVIREDLSGYDTHSIVFPDGDNTMYMWNWLKPEEILKLTLEAFRIRVVVESHITGRKTREYDKVVKDLIDIGALKDASDEEVTHLLCAYSTC